MLKSAVAGWSLTLTLYRIGLVSSPTSFTCTSFTFSHLELVSSNLHSSSTCSLSNGQVCHLPHFQNMQVSSKQGGSLSRRWNPQSLPLGTPNKLHVTPKWLKLSSWGIKEQISHQTRASKNNIPAGLDQRRGTKVNTEMKDHPLRKNLIQAKHTKEEIDVQRVVIQSTLKVSSVLLWSSSARPAVNMVILPVCATKCRYLLYQGTPRHISCKLE